MFSNTVVGYNGQVHMATTIHMCQGRSTPYVGDGHLTFNRNRYNGYINPYYWVDDHPYYMEIMGV